MFKQVVNFDSDEQLHQHVQTNETSLAVDESEIDMAINNYGYNKNKQIIENEQLIDQFKIL